MLNEAAFYDLDKALANKEIMGNGQFYADPSKVQAKLDKITGDAAKKQSAVSAGKMSQALKDGREVTFKLNDDNNLEID